METQDPKTIHLVGRNVPGKSRKSRRPSKPFRSGNRIRQSGIYRVTHTPHRLPHEVTLLKGESFPTCLQCQEAVEFELLRPVPQIQEVSGFLVKLHALPEVERRRMPRGRKEAA